jgi:hypothetical protein
VRPLSRHLAEPHPQISIIALAQAIFDGVDDGLEDIFPDPMSQSLAQSWRSGTAKTLERQYGALIEAQPVT